MKHNDSCCSQDCSCRETQGSGPSLRGSVDEQFVRDLAKRHRESVEAALAGQPQTPTENKHGCCGAGHCQQHASSQAHVCRKELS